MGPGKRVLWIHCASGKSWFFDCFRSSANRKDALQRVISENMLVDVVQILEPKTLLHHWEFQIIVASATEASVLYLCQEQLLKVTRPRNGGCATFVVQTGSHPGISSQMVEVQVRKPQYPCDIKEFVEKLIESMQELASKAGKLGGFEGACLRALEGLRVWTVPNNTRKD